MAEQLKELFSKKFVNFIAVKTKEYYPSFEQKNFQDTIINDNWQNLELKERMRLIAVVFNDFIPLPYSAQLEILKKVKIDLSYEDSMGLQSMIFQDFVEVFGLEDYDNSIKALESFTIDSSSEFAIRQFILKYEDKTMSQMNIWAKDENEHIRRLATEGCRPRLPWAIALPIFKKDPTKVLEIIETLKFDTSKYVQKSVANNLNDISKDNAQIVIDFVKNNLGQTKDLDWICKHGSRTLLKKGDKQILPLFGFGDSSHVNITNLEYDDSLSFGEDFVFTFTLNSEEDLGNLRIEYGLHYKKANGSHSKKVFMISQNSINEKEKSFSKKQSFKNMTTRKHYAGEHYISIIINGIEKEKGSFYLNDTSN